MIEHMTDDLELYAVGALRSAEADRVTAHLAGCPACRAELAEIATVVNALPDTVAPREPPARLKDRILSAAATDLARPATRETAWTFRPTRGWLGIGALAAVAVLLLVLDLNSLRELRAAESERAEYALIAEKVSHGGSNWYMVGLDQWQGAGGTLFAPGKPDLSPFVVFHDLRPLTGGAMYAVWLVDADGHWVRGANFSASGHAIQGVDLTVPVDSFAQCAVTIEMQAEGKRSGPLVMQSRIAPPGQ
ncbi:MAG TPA: anti-sigma factor [Candidatus Limnocylindria bacterium]|nr:anti-sigma factor [Candidatus Limnocylindria bacterium]